MAKLNKKAGGNNNNGNKANEAPIAQSAEDIMAATNPVQATETQATGAVEPQTDTTAETADATSVAVTPVIATDETAVQVAAFDPATAENAAGAAQVSREDAAKGNTPAVIAAREGKAKRDADRKAEREAFEKMAVRERMVFIASGDLGIYEDNTDFWDSQATLAAAMGHPAQPIFEALAEMYMGLCGVPGVAPVAIPTIVAKMMELPADYVALVKPKATAAGSERATPKVNHDIAVGDVVDLTDKYAASIGYEAADSHGLTVMAVRKGAVRLGLFEGGKPRPVLTVDNVPAENVVITARAPKPEAAPAATVASA